MLTEGTLMSDKANVGLAGTAAVAADEVLVRCWATLSSSSMG